MKGRQGVILSVGRCVIKITGETVLNRKQVMHFFMNWFTKGLAFVIQYPVCWASMSIVPHCKVMLHENVEWSLALGLSSWTRELWTFFCFAVRWLSKTSADSNYIKLYQYLRQESVSHFCRLGLDRCPECFIFCRMHLLISPQRKSLVLLTDETCGLGLSCPASTEKAGHRQQFEPIV